MKGYKSIIKDKKGMEEKMTITTGIFALLAVLILGAVLFYFFQQSPVGWWRPQPGNDNFSGVKYFSSMKEISEYLNSSMGAGRGYYGYGMMAETATMKSGVSAPMANAVDSASGGGQRAGDYSTTNVQVQGVDEPDIVKNDDKYIYTLSGGKVSIIDAYPSDSMKILSTLNVSSANNIFIYNDKLVVYSYGYEYIKMACPEPGPLYSETVAAANEKMIAPDYYPRDCGYSRPLTYVYIYDIEDRENPKLEQNFSLDGNYVDARMIDDYIYTITSKSAYTGYGYMGIELPRFMKNDELILTQAEDVGYFNVYDSSYVFTSISALNLRNGKFDSKVFMTGYTGTVYMSEDVLYLTNTKYLSPKFSFDKFIEMVVLPLMPDSFDDSVREIADGEGYYWNKQHAIQELVYNYSNSLKGDEKEAFDEKAMNLSEEYYVYLSKESEKTVIHRIEIDDLEIEYDSSGEVPGHVLNQFSMDEYEGNLRIATTTGNSWNGNSLNHLYILDDSMRITGSVENLAEGEKIYSARFIGGRAYIVTFKKVDPLFVIDLENPTKPKVLGYLKITGFSDYLHPYDENHIIGIGKEARGGGENFAWYQGMKISLFDVSDVENPREVASSGEIGARGTDSYALHDHKAFLFDKEKNLLVIPISLAEISQERIDEQREQAERYGYTFDPDNIYGETVWQGAYVYDISPSGIRLRGRITHQEGFVKSEENNYWYSDWGREIKRSLFMDNTLYTVSDKIVRANDFLTLNQTSFVQLPYGYDYRYYGDVVGF